jgi:hypothetical protein
MTPRSCADVHQRLPNGCNAIGHDIDDVTATVCVTSAFDAAAVAVTALLYCVGQQSACSVKPAALKLMLRLCLIVLLVLLSLLLRSAIDPVADTSTAAASAM